MPVTGPGPDVAECEMNDNQMEDLTASSSAASSCAEMSGKLEDSSEAFQFPKRRKRPSTAISSVSSGATIITTAPLQPTLTVILKPTDPDKSLAKINPLKISEKLEMTAPDGVILVRPNRRLNLLAIDCRNTESTKALLKLESIGGIPVQAYAPHSREAAKGVIYGVQEDISDVQLESSVRATAPVLCLRRLGKSEVVKLVFSTNTLPAYVTIGYTRLYRDHRDAFELPEEIFRKQYRLPKIVVRWLCDELREEPEVRRVRTSWTVMTVELQVLCALRFYGTGSFQGMVASDEHVARDQKTVSVAVRAVSVAILRRLGVQRGWIHFPETPSERFDAEKGFRLLGRIPGVIGCVDGTMVSIVGPSKNYPTVTKAAYWCRKYFYALNVIVVVHSCYVVKTRPNL
ncbi:hypothetical protein ISCGN_013556 [Ixodes scapularis]